MAAKAENTAQPHVLVTRKEIEKLLPDPMSTLNLVVPPAGDEQGWASLLAEMRRVPEKDFGADWRLTDKTSGGVGLMGWQFSRPVYTADVDLAMYTAMKGAGYTARTSKLVESWEKGVANMKGDEVGVNPKGHKDTDIVLGRASMLTNTSKMGCYSWNLPAGPTKYKGTCPGAAMLFDTSGLGLLGKDPLANLKRLAAVRRHTAIADEAFIASIPKTQTEAVRRFICNGCYALKGQYGNPSNIVNMGWKKKWLQGYALPTGQFVSIMVQAITMASRKTAYDQQRATTPELRAAIPHPAYFRIHDAGDFWSNEYMAAWFEVCERLPHMHFWAPTRIWTAAGTAGWLERMIAQGKLPKNLCLRPSGLFFDAPEPQIPGLDGGTSSNTITFNTKTGRIRLNISDTGEGTWGCPAYLPEVIGGGAGVQVKTAKQMLEDKGKLHFEKFNIEGKQNAYKMTVKPYGKRTRTYKGKDIDELERKIDRLIRKLPKANPVSNEPEQQAYAMYPKIDDATLERKDLVFYDALYDPQGQHFIVDPKTGRPMKANKTTLRQHKGAIVMKAQAYQAAGACPVARDPYHAAECRVCWGTSQDKRRAAMKRLPVVYGKH
jgi:hypothetical protein